MEVIYENQGPTSRYLASGLVVGLIAVLASVAGFPEGSLVLGIVAAISVALSQQTLP